MWEFLKLNSAVIVSLSFEIQGVMFCVNSFSSELKGKTKLDSSSIEDFADSYPLSNEVKYPLTSIKNRYKNSEYKNIYLTISPYFSPCNFGLVSENNKINKLFIINFIIFIFFVRSILTVCSRLA